jgi:hypothetical protein
MLISMLKQPMTTHPHRPEPAAVPAGLATSMPRDSVIFVISAAVIIALVRIVLYRRLCNLI